MQWILNYQLFLFDFDGLLVNTEWLHYQAYIKMCAERGFTLNWSFDRYSQAAHYDSTALRDQIYAEFPKLYMQEPIWSVLYEEKKEILLKLADSLPVPLMPGVEGLLKTLQEADIPRCVVTNSPSSLIERIRNQNPILETIPYWITRENYTHAKPDPECYQIAIQKYAKAQDRIIGFEDSPKGLQALLQTKSHPVLICPPQSPYLQQLLHSYPDLEYYPSFTHIALQNGDS